MYILIFTHSQRLRCEGGWEEERGSESEREIQFTWASAWRRFDQAANERRPLALNRRSPAHPPLDFPHAPDMATL